MNTKRNIISKLLMASAFVFSLSSCGEGSAVTSVIFDDNYQAEWRVGEIDFSALKFIVTYANGVVESVPVTPSMIEEKDLYKFYQPGECRVKINYNSRFYNIIDFVIYENTFADDIKLVNETIAYDGKSHSLELAGALPEGTNVYYPYGNSYTNYSVEPYQIKCILSKEGYQTKELNGKLTITQSEYSKEILDQIIFEDAEYTYDGLDKKITASNVPQDCTIEYFIDNVKGNSRSNAGVYKVVGKLTCNNFNYLPIPNITAYLTINKAKYNTENLKFEDKIVQFQEGVQQYVEVSGLSSLPNVKVEYNNSNYGLNVGTYHATAKFIGDPNYERIPDMEADLIITPAEIDLSDVVIQKPQITKYDGTVKDYEIEVPKTIEVVKTYYNQSGVKVDNPIDVGIYTVQLDYKVNSKLTDTNYTIINKPTETGLLVVEKKVLDLGKLNFEKSEYQYDSLNHEFVIETDTKDEKEVLIHNEIPEELNIKKTYFLNGTELGENELPLKVGDYSVAFDISLKEGLNADNYSIVNAPTKNGLLSITKIQIDLKRVVVNDQIYEYTGKEQSYQVAVPNDVIVDVVYTKDGQIVEKPVELGRYNINLNFTLKEDETKGITNENYELVNMPQTSATMTISKKTVNVDNVDAKDLQVAYTGFGIAYGVENLINFEEVSEYVNPVFRYFQNGTELQELPKEVGSYMVYISFELNAEHSPDYYRIVSSAEFFSVNMTIA